MPGAIWPARLSIIDLHIRRLHRRREIVAHRHVHEGFIFLALHEIGRDAEFIEAALAKGDWIARPVRLTVPTGCSQIFSNALAR